MYSNIFVIITNIYRYTYHCHKYKCGSNICVEAIYKYDALYKYTYDNLGVYLLMV